MENVTINRNELFDFFAQFKGSALMTMTYFVDESRAKQVKGAKVLKKRVTINFGVGVDYAKKVNRKLLVQGETNDFIPCELPYAIKLDNSKNLLLCKKDINKDYKTLEISNEELISQAKNFDKDFLASKALVQCITENKPQSVYYFYTNPETGLTSEIAYSDLKKGVHVTPGFFDKKGTVGRGAVSEENDFRIFNPYLSNLESIKFGGKIITIK